MVAVKHEEHSTGDEADGSNVIDSGSNPKRGSGRDSVASDPNSDCSSSKLEPDADAIKLFVGQVPRDWNEAMCRTLFEEFGDIHTISVLRDKRTGISRGEWQRIDQV